jgi:hypothetical protein
MTASSHGSMGTLPRMLVPIALAALLAACGAREEGAAAEEPEKILYDSNELSVGRGLPATDHRSVLVGPAGARGRSRVVEDQDRAVRIARLSLQRRHRAWKTAVLLRHPA